MSNKEAIISLISGILLYSCFPFISYLLAKKKRRNAKAWCIAGFFFVHISLFILICSPTLTEEYLRKKEQREEQKKLEHIAYEKEEKLRHIAYEKEWKFHHSAPYVKEYLRQREQFLDIEERELKIKKKELEIEKLRKEIRG